MQPQHNDASSNLHVNSKLFQNAINGVFWHCYHRWTLCQSPLTAFSGDAIHYTKDRGFVLICGVR